MLGATAGALTVSVSVARAAPVAGSTPAVTSDGRAISLGRGGAFGKLVPIHARVLLEAGLAMMARRGTMHALLPVGAVFPSVQSTLACRKLARELRELGPHGYHGRQALLHVLMSP